MSVCWASDVGSCHNVLARDLVVSDRSDLASDPHKTGLGDSIVWLATVVYVWCGKLTSSLIGSLMSDEAA